MNVSFLIGERGTGKTCIFELLSEGILRFQRNGDQCKQVMVQIDAKLDYKALKEQVITGIISQFKDESLNYMLVWEIWIACMIVDRIEKEGNAIPKSLKEEVEYFKRFFSPETAKRSVIKMFLDQKKQLGFKIDPSKMPGLFAYDFYASWGGDIEPTTFPSKSPNILRFGNLKKELNNYLDSINTIFYILIDKLDEFLIREEYEAQVLSLQGLISLEKSYQKYKNLKLKIFMRQDLFSKLDKTELGSDKTIFRSVEIKWNYSDIYRFIGTRILFNYLRVFDLDRLTLEMDDAKLYIDKASNDLSTLEKRKTHKLMQFCKFIAKKILNIAPKVIRNPVYRIYDSGKFRRTNLDEHINLLLIKSFLGDVVLHKNKSAVLKEIPIQKYLQTHFEIGSGIITPRIVLMFLKYCISETLTHYKENSDLGTKHSFPLIPKECVPRAYQTLRDKLWEILADESKQWKNHILRLRDEIRTSEFNYNLAKRKLKINSNLDISSLYEQMEVWKV